MRRTTRKHPDLLTKPAILSSAMTSTRISLMQFVAAAQMIRRRRKQFSNDDTKDSEVVIRSRGSLKIGNSSFQSQTAALNGNVSTKKSRQIAGIGSSQRSRQIASAELIAPKSPRFASMRIFHWK
jgi:hypothetical protein